ncbi:hypothetical protein AG1IA_00717 [Rhizoctonia solani AG-1 IA]|uniref:Uncharacterized protein n=1 Tax=Thanatephorus cucumeris (strain AG1-IA) TaxID=983506 RepID=L8X837_THACA|nr:hypothetical protein AG1IA_00717 [Rhizoctonia solani AG-1 IA]
MTITISGGSRMVFAVVGIFQRAAPTLNKRHPICTQLCNDERAEFAIHTSDNSEAAGLVCGIQWMDHLHTDDAHPQTKQ